MPPRHPPAPSLESQVARMSSRGNLSSRPGICSYSGLSLSCSTGSWPAQQTVGRLTRTKGKRLSSARVGHFGLEDLKGPTRALKQCRSVRPSGAGRNQRRSQGPRSEAFTCRRKRGNFRYLGAIRAFCATRISHRLGFDFSSRPRKGPGGTRPLCRRLPERPVLVGLGAVHVAVGSGGVVVERVSRTREEHWG